MHSCQNSCPMLFCSRFDSWQLSAFSLSSSFVSKHPNSPTWHKSSKAKEMVMSFIKKGGFEKLVDSYWFELPVLCHWAMTTRGEACCHDNYTTNTHHKLVYVYINFATSWSEMSPCNNLLTTFSHFLKYKLQLMNSTTWSYNKKVKLVAMATVIHT